MLFRRGGLELIWFMLTSHQQELFPHQSAPHCPASEPRFETKQLVLIEVANTGSKGQAAVTGKEGITVKTQPKQFKPGGRETSKGFNTK